MRMTIPFGRYIETDSLLHKLDPRAKILAMFLYLFTILMISSLYWLGITAVITLVILWMTRISFKAFARSLRPLRFLIAFIFIFPIIFHEHSIWDGVAQGTLMAGRMILFILFAALLTYTTQTARLTQGLESLLQPFRRLGVSPEKWSLMINLALRFVPTIIEEAKVVLKAQASRGVDFMERSWREKASALIPLLVPITLNTFRRAQDLSDSMEARGFVPGVPRTSFYELVWRTQDTWFIVGCSLFLLCSLAWRLMLPF